MWIFCIVLGGILVFLNIKAIQKDNGKVEDFSSLFNSKKENMDEYMLEIGAVRRDMAETIMELQKEIEVLKEEINQVRRESLVNDSKVVKDEVLQGEKEFLLQGEDYISEINFDNYKENIVEKRGKTEVVGELIKKGLTDDEICERLSLGKGEVALIRNLIN